MSTLLQIKDIAPMFNLSIEAIRHRLKYVKQRPVNRKIVNGRMCCFYDVEHVKEALAGRLTNRWHKHEPDACKVSTMEEAVKANRRIGLSLMQIAKRVHENPAVVSAILSKCGMI